MTIVVYTLVLVAVVTCLIAFGAVWYTLSLLKATSKQVRDELQRTREDLECQRLWNTNLEGVVKLLQEQVRAQAASRRN